VKVLKSGISITLLFAYLLGFSHSLTPHCEIHCEDLAESNHHYRHEHAIGSTDLDLDNHIAHGDHYDEGWVDYLVCLLSDFHHQCSGFNAEYFVNHENVQFKKSFQQNNDQASEFAVFRNSELIIQKILTSLIRITGPPVGFESQAYTYDFAQRGPPFYSC
jgi:hypothetical protein